LLLGVFFFGKSSAHNAVLTQALPTGFSIASTFLARLFCFQTLPFYSEAPLSGPIFPASKFLVSSAILMKKAIGSSPALNAIGKFTAEIKREKFYFIKYSAICFEVLYLVIYI
jgi:hypothetical protein